MFQSAEREEIVIRIKIATICGLSVEGDLSVTEWTVDTSGSIVRVLNPIVVFEGDLRGAGFVLSVYHRVAYRL